MTRSIDERFFAKVRITSDCWVWLGATAGADWKRGLGYGKFWSGESVVSAHRFAYERMVGAIPAGLDLDHLCRNRQCVRPDHLEPVTRQVNTARGVTLPAANLAKTHCPKGHPYAGANLIVHRKPNGRTSRRCRTCVNARFRELRRERRSA